MSMRFARLMASMVADAALTVVTGGIWIAMCSDANGGSFTNKEMLHQRYEEQTQNLTKVFNELRRHNKC